MKLFIDGRISCQFLKYLFCYFATNVTKMVTFYVTTSTLFAGQVTIITAGHNNLLCLISPTHVNFNFVTLEFNASEDWGDKVSVHPKLSLDKVQHYDSYVTKYTKGKLHNV